VWGVTLLGASACVFVMQGLPASAWIAFGVWMLIGLTLYFAYGYRHSVLRRPR
jgi:APA family basic amino acid/polyamine antiporter